MIYEGIELIKYLSLKFGPSGSEEDVREAVIEQLKSFKEPDFVDSMGNVFYKISAKKSIKNPKRMMISSHMDEVGFMIDSVDSDGYMSFQQVGGINDKVLYGKTVQLKIDGKLVNGVIEPKPIHLKSKGERTEVVASEDLSVFCGKEYAGKKELVGTFGTFKSPFVVFGENKEFMKSKALDDRVGCAVMIELIRKIIKEKAEFDVDLFFCFTVREEVGYSGAYTASYRVNPDYAIVLETTAISDLPIVPKERYVADVNMGGAISLMDNASVYQRKYVDFFIDVAKKKGIPYQVKRYVSGGNDAGHIHTSRDGVWCLALSLPSRYLHSPACVGSYKDYLSIKELIIESLKEIERLG